MTMDCNDLIARLDALLDGRLAGQERREMEEHLRVCTRCRDLAAAFGGEPGGVKIEAPSGLAEAILSRTSGPACASARDQLCDHVDRLLDPVGDELVRMHLQGCVECAALARALARMSADLPSLAELEPDARFVVDVLAKTRPCKRSTAAWIESLVQEWRHLIRRPRFAWEGAYFGMLILVLISGTPSVPLAGVPRKAIDWVRKNPVSGLREPVEELAPQVKSSVSAAWEVTRGGVIDGSSELTGNVVRRSSDLFQEARKNFGTLFEHLPLQQETDDMNRPVDEDGPDEGEKP